MDKKLNINTEMSIEVRGKEYWEQKIENIKALIAILPSGLDKIALRKTK